ncbi:hypothetical protein PR048_019967 [Dryococelus australis]|uniref:B box-type domain-containing protein n=1 Tax=Dryococelus australis TaxID=614101 RepID=A0ABQ9H4Z1_9NEOP|nr:hypothetical protein PR048_019967 [Dryococelus australis]
MIGFKGKTSIKQYLPMKPIKRGFKVRVVACAVLGYMIKFKIYEGKTSMLIEGTLGERTVLSLAKSFETLGYCLFFDRIFSSVTCLRTLLQKGLFGCGTIMQNRKHFLKNLLKTEKDLTLGDSDYAVCGEISVTKWKDREMKSVVVINNMHNPENSSSVERSNKYGNKHTVTCPTCISDCNMNVGGVDRYDQIMRTPQLSILIFCTKKQKRSVARKSNQHGLSYRSALAGELIDGFCIHLTNVGVNVPVKATIRRCAHCSTKNKPRRSSLICKTCQVVLCTDCFAPFHGQ